MSGAKDDSRELKIAIHTLGCRTNQADSVLIARNIEHLGRLVPFDTNDADVYIINTCTVTNAADRQSRQMVYRALRKNPDALVIATGCYAAVAADELRRLIPDAAIVPGFDPDSVERIIKDALNIKGDVETDSNDLPLLRRRENLKVQSGCPMNCSYCIVPKARPGSVSVPYHQIASWVEDFLETGVQELVLTGTNIALYGRDFEKKTTLSWLLKRLSEDFPAVRFRVSSIEPMFVRTELLETMASLPNVCHHLHLPLQSGSDSVLERMRRPYTASKFRKLVELARSIMPSITIGSDVIVGFPQETEEEFEDSLGFVEELELSYLHVFPMSLRRGTEAASMNGKIDPATIKDRSARMRKLAYEKKLKFYRAAQDTAVRVVFESWDGEHATGVSRGYRFVRVEGVDSLPNGELYVRIVKIDKRRMLALGEIVEEQ